MLFNTESLGQIWKWAKFELSTEFLKYNLLLAKDERKQTICHYASLWDNLQVLRSVSKWSKEQLTT